MLSPLTETLFPVPCPADPYVSWVCSLTPQIWAGGPPTQVLYHLPSAHVTVPQPRWNAILSTVFLLLFSLVPTGPSTWQVPSSICGLNEQSKKQQQRREEKRDTVMTFGGVGWCACGTRLIRFSDITSFLHRSSTITLFFLLLNYKNYAPLVFLRNKQTQILSRITRETIIICSVFMLHGSFLKIFLKIY